MTAERVRQILREFGNKMSINEQKTFKEYLHYKISQQEETRRAKIYFENY